MTVQCVKRHARVSIRYNGHQRWDIGESGQDFYLCKPFLKNYPRLDYLNFKLHRKMLQQRTGYSKLNDYRHKLGQVETRYCEFGQIETVQHYLLGCPLYDEARYTLMKLHRKMLQLRTGYSKLNDYRHKLGQVETRYCEFGQIETVQHYLLECPLYDEARYTLMKLHRKMLQLRTGYSKLNDYRHKLGQVETRYCEFGQIETVQHYLLECPLYDEARYTLMKLHRKMLQLRTGYSKLNDYRHKLGQVEARYSEFGQIETVQHYLLECPLYDEARYTLMKLHRKMLQLRTGYSKLNDYRHKLGQVETRYCEFGQIETVQHYLLECPLYDEARYTLMKLHRKMLQLRTGYSKLNDYRHKLGQVETRYCEFGQIETVQHYLLERPLYEEARYTLMKLHRKMLLLRTGYSKLNDYRHKLGQVETRYSEFEQIETVQHYLLECPLYDEARYTLMKLHRKMLQLRTGYSKLNDYRHKLGQVETRYCEFGQIETVQHYLLECPLYDEARYTLMKLHRKMLQLRTGYSKLNDYRHKLGQVETRYSEFGQIETVQHYLLECPLYEEARYTLMKLHRKMLQLRTGYSKLNDYRHKLGQVETRYSEFGQIETVQHYLPECPLYDEARYTLMKRLREEIGIQAPNIFTLLGYDSPVEFPNCRELICEEVGHFIERTERFEEKKEQMIASKYFFPNDLF